MEGNPPTIQTVAKLLGASPPAQLAAQTLISLASSKAPSGKRKSKPRRFAQLSQQELEDFIKPNLRTLACSEPWVDLIVRMLAERDKHGRPVVKHKVDSSGRLAGDPKTRFARLLEAIGDALVYPPPADHAGMLPCHCPDCTRINADGKKRHVLWPAIHMIRGRSYDCAKGRIGGGVWMEETSNPLSIVSAAEQRYPDPDAWRADKTSRVLRRAIDKAYRFVTSDPPPPAEWIAPALLVTALDRNEVFEAISKHKWTRVDGNAKVDAAGNTIRGSVKLHKRGLNNIGSLADFLDLGHKLTEVQGLAFTHAQVIEKIVRDHPREPRMRQGRAVKWQTIRLGKRS